MDTFLLGYIGPETMMPAMSVLAAVGGVLLAFWRTVTHAVTKPFRLLFGKADAQSAPVAEVGTSTPGDK